LFKNGKGTSALATDVPLVRKGSIVRFRAGVILRGWDRSDLLTVLTHPRMVVIDNHEVLTVNVMDDDGQLYRISHADLEVAQEEL
jgi:hypothetical protein